MGSTDVVSKSRESNVPFSIDAVKDSKDFLSVIV